jgi:hypothetical protein
MTIVASTPGPGKFNIGEAKIHSAVLDSEKENQ